MAVYADKKKGVLTGRWRVELQKGTRGLPSYQAYRQRFDTHEEAVIDDERVKAAWEAGEGPAAAARAIRISSTHSIASVTQEASGTLWAGMPSERNAWTHIKVIGEIIGAELCIDEIETPHLTKAIRELSRTGIKPATVNRYLSHFRTFLIWAQDEGFRTVPVAKLKFRWMKEPVGRIRWITAEEEAQLQAFLPENFWMLVKVAIETGCRRTELLTLEARDVNGGLLHLWETKTNSPRTVPISQETADMLNHLLKGAMPSERGLRSWWDRAKVAMGLEHDEQFVFHTCRHTCATRLVDQGENILVIKEWLGHKRIETTQRYAHVKPSNLQEALIRRGAIATLAAQEAQKSAANGAPPPPPTGGGLGLEITDKAA